MLFFALDLTICEQAVLRGHANFVTCLAVRSPSQHKWQDPSVLVPKKVDGDNVDWRKPSSDDHQATLFTGSLDSTIIAWSIRHAEKLYVFEGV